MPVERFRSVEEMPSPWRDADDPDNLRIVAQVMALHRKLVPRPKPGVQRFRNMEEANAEPEKPQKPTAHIMPLLAPGSAGLTVGVEF